MHWAYDFAWTGRFFRTDVAGPISSLALPGWQYLWMAASGMPALTTEITLARTPNTGARSSKPTYVATVTRIDLSRNSAGRSSASGSTRTWWRQQTESRNSSGLVGNPSQAEGHVGCATSVSDENHVESMRCIGRIRPGKSGCGSRSREDRYLKSHFPVGENRQTARTSKSSVV